MFELPILKGLQISVPLSYVVYLLPTSNLEEQILLSTTILFSAVLFLQSFVLSCTHTGSMFSDTKSIFKIKKRRSSRISAEKF